MSFGITYYPPNFFTLCQIINTLIFLSVNLDHSELKKLASQRHNTSCMLTDKQFALWLVYSSYLLIMLKIIYTKILNILSGNKLFIITLSWFEAIKKYTFHGESLQLQLLLKNSFHMLPSMSRRLFNNKEHQNFLESEKQLKIKQFQSILAYKTIQTIQYEDGSIYKGEITQSGLRNGYGMLLSSDRSVYLGKFKNDLYHQEGIYLYNDGQRYEGEIVQGSKQGIGKMFYLNGDIYEGQWIQDSREGKGQISYANGDRFIGDWKDNKPYGQGSYYSGIKLIAEGMWDDSKFLNGKVSTEEYEGQWANGGPQGRGVYKFEDGALYQGNWLNGQKYGMGKYYYPNGDIYQGQFRCGLKHGKGFYKYNSGDSYEGEYYNDLKQGYGVMRFTNGDEYHGEWRKDLFHGPGNYIFNIQASQRKGQAQIKTNFQYGKPHQQESLTNHPLLSQSPKQFSPIPNTPTKNNLFGEPKIPNYAHLNSDREMRKKQTILNKELNLNQKYFSGERKLN